MTHPTPSTPPLDEERRTDWDRDDDAVDDYVPPSPEAMAALVAGIKSAKEQPPIYRGSFAQYADDDE